MLHHTIYQHQESTEWVTFVHGAGGSSSIWFRQIREYSKHFNVLLVDLRGHGQSKDAFSIFNKNYTFDAVTNDVIEVLDYLKISQSHFVGMSLGTIIIRKMAEIRPKLVSSMVMGGAVMKLNLRGRFLMGIGNTFKSIVPYMWLYTILAHIIMPKTNHKESRNMFIQEAKKLYKREFKRWYKLTAEINPLLKFFREKDTGIPTLYIMGEEDHMFLPSVQQIVDKHKKTKLHIIEACGHVVNVEQPSIFNEISLKFIQGNLLLNRT
ncbi:alpha/beta fold hydrolase [Flavobacteriaceae bacterium Ap0902]|nr:alpha/beta fold hydrolase [Flavobacteriaceae bacterium Ap0902]